MRTLVGSLSLLWLLMSDVRAQSYSIDWLAISGGGKTITGSTYQITGTIGQPAAHLPMTNANYSLTGGFWSLYAVQAVQTPGAPLLSISRTNGGVIISWLSASTNWVLQESASLNSAVWVTASETITTNGVTRFIIINPPVGNRFYRLTGTP